MTAVQNVFLVKKVVFCPKALEKHKIVSIMHDFISQLQLPVRHLCIWLLTFSWCLFVLYTGLFAPQSWHPSVIKFLNPHTWFFAPWQNLVIKHLTPQSPTGLFLVQTQLCVLSSASCCNKSKKPAVRPWNYLSCCFLNNGEWCYQTPKLAYCRRIFLI